jgi:hypothetical protein
MAQTSLDYYGKKLYSGLHANTQVKRNDAINKIDDFITLAYDIVQKDQIADGIGGTLYDVPIYNQNGYSLCWAFSQVMIEEWQKKQLDPDYQFMSQKEATERAIKIAKKYHGTGIKEDHVNVYGPYVDFVKGWDNGGWPPQTETINASVLDVSILDGLLESNPLYAYYSSGKSAHLIVVTGILSASGHETLVATNNPWGDQNIQTYDEFLNGFPRGNKNMRLSSIRVPDLRGVQ